MKSNTIGVRYVLGVLLMLVIGGSVAAQEQTLYVANYANARGNGYLSKFTLGGTGGMFYSNTSAPYGVALDVQGNLYVVDKGVGNVLNFTPTGNPLGIFASGLNGPVALAFDRDGNLYVSNYGTGTIQKFSPSGASLGYFISSGLSLPVSVAFDSSGDVPLSAPFTVWNATFVIDNFVAVWRNV